MTTWSVRIPYPVEDIWVTVTAAGWRVDGNSLVFVNELGHDCHAFSAGSWLEVRGPLTPPSPES